MKPCEVVIYSEQDHGEPYVTAYCDVHDTVLVEHLSSISLSEVQLALAGHAWKLLGQER